MAYILVKICLRDAGMQKLKLNVERVGRGVTCFYAKPAVNSDSLPFSRLYPQTPGPVDRLTHRDKTQCPREQMLT